MSDNTLFSTSQGGVVFTPDAFAELRVYPEYFIHDCQSKLDDYQRTRAVLYGQSVGRPLQESHLLRRVGDEIRRAEMVIADLHQLQEGQQRIYTWNFVNLAEAFRQTRVQLGLQRIEDDPSLYAAVRNVMTMLKAENPKFNAVRFMRYINGEGQVVCSF